MSKQVICDKCGKEAATQTLFVEVEHYAESHYDDYEACLCDSCAKPVIELLKEGKPA